MIARHAFLGAGHRTRIMEAAHGGHLGDVVAAAAPHEMPATPANAATYSMSLSLSIGSNAGCAPNRELVSGEVLVRMPPSEANANYTRYNVRLEGLGDDDWTNGGDNLEFDFNPNSINVVSTGLLWTYGSCVLKSDLNEDPIGGDEIFVKAKLRNGADRASRAR